MEEWTDQLPVSVWGEDGFVTQVTTDMNASYFLRPAEQSEDESAIATIAKSDFSQVTVRANRGFMLRAWKFQNENEERDLVARSRTVVETFARAHHIILLEGEQILSGCLYVELGTIAATQSRERIPVASPQNLAHPDDRCISNRATMRRTSLLSDTSPGGIELKANSGSYVFGEVDYTNTLVGSIVTLPSGTRPKQTISV
ncbi:hypothetical protein S40293_09330 [Stachybotrys chartarum IBT 40293]|nr:hypothetical protein S40293_09330 [Stachybotrys chartarum IBT 40293]